MSAFQIIRNTATLSNGQGNYKRIRVKSNSSHTQRTIFNIDGDSKTISGTGERNAILGEIELPATVKSVSVEFTYSIDNTNFVPCSIVQGGGPYNVGRYNMAVLVVENGDGADVNDIIVEFTSA